MSYKRVSYDRVCEYCGKRFVAHDKRNRFCSKKCKDISFRLRTGVKCNPKTEPFHKICVVCGEPFDSFREARKTCSNDECIQLYRKTRGKPKREPKTCAICGKMFVPIHDAQATCGGESCKSEYRANHRRDYYERVKQQKAANEKIINYVLTECQFCGGIFYADERIGKKYCSSVCGKKAQRKRHDKRIPKSQRVDRISLERLYQRDGGKCYICGCDCDFGSWRFAQNGNKYPGDSYPTVDHVVPVSAGGFDAWNNVRLACWKCNVEKSDKIISVDALGNSFAYSAAAKKSEKKTAQYTLDGKLIRVWDSTAQIRRETGLNDGYIQNVCRRHGSNTGNAYGYHWEYIDEQLEKTNARKQTLTIKDIIGDYCGHNRQQTRRERPCVVVEAVQRNTSGDRSIGRECSER